MTFLELRKLIREAMYETFSEASEDFDIEKVFHLSQIPTEELEQQYVDYSSDSDFEGYRYDHILAEEINIDKQAAFAKSEMMRIYSMKDWQIRIVKTYNKVEVIILYAGILKNTNIIKAEMERLGFFPSIQKWKFAKFMLWRAIKFEPYKQEDFSYSAKKYGFLLHITPSYNNDSIMKNGLLPRSNNNLFNYPNRVYLLAGDIDKGNMYQLASRLYKQSRKTDKNNNGEYSVFLVDTKKTPKDIKFYADPNHPKAYFTNQVIPPNCLRLYSMIQV